MRARAIAVAVILLATQLPGAAAAEPPIPKIAVAYDIGFLGDNGFNDAVHSAFITATKKRNLVEPFIREIPTSGTAVDRLTRLRFLAKSGYTLIITVGAGYRETVRRVSQEYPLVQFAPINDRTLGQLNISNVYFDESEMAYLAGAIAAYQSTRGTIAIVNGNVNLVDKFKAGAARIKRKIDVREVQYKGDNSSLKLDLAGVDVVYSLWNQDASLYSWIASQKRRIWYVGRAPDQFFVKVAPEFPRVLAILQKDLSRPISQLVRLAMEDRIMVDILDESGIYGRRYSLRNGGIKVLFGQGANSALRSRIDSEIRLLTSRG
jgi:basic membrane lipoprotein Med (substrate-binding protein (PBP1-ABC) superfamily)